jgi:Na+-driven multidrug efflux pump
MSDTTLSKEEKQYKRLTEEPVARLVLELGLPTTISMLITNLYNMVDTWFVSQLGTSATGAVGVVFGLMAIIQAFGFMFGHGAGSNISRLLGAHEKERAKAFSATGFYLAVGAGVLIAVIGIVDLNGLCRLLGSTETILPYARIYAFYILVSAPAMASSCVMNNVLRYEGYANLAMVGLASGGILNMAGDAILVGVKSWYPGSSTFHYDLPVRILWNPVILFPTWKDPEQPDTEIFYLGICGT